MRIEFIEISEQDLPSIIRLSYEGDEDLLNKYHVDKFTLEQAVECELGIIKKDTEVMNLTYYKVVFDKIDIGYLVSSGDLILSFCINIKFRTKVILKEWWDMMVSFFGDKIKFGVLSNNQRAIQFFKKRGMKIAWENSDKKEKADLLITF